jgi:hypothetical protein
MSNMGVDRELFSHDVFGYDPLSVLRTVWVERGASERGSDGASWASCIGVCTVELIVFAGVEGGGMCDGISTVSQLE